MNKLGIFMNFWENSWKAEHIKYIKKAADIGFDVLEFQAQPLLEINRTVPGKGHINWDEIFKALADIHFKGRIVSEPFMVTGGEVGRDICVWRNLIDNPTEEELDKNAVFLLDFERSMMKKWGV